MYLLENMPVSMEEVTFLVNDHLFGKEKTSFPAALEVFPRFETKQKNPP